MSKLWFSSDWPRTLTRTGFISMKLGEATFIA
jgi:hypothetical protein